MTNQEALTEGRPQRKVKKLRIALALLVILVVGALGVRLFGAFSLLASGDQVDIGGREIFIRCEGTGSPTVILEHGLGSTGNEWASVQDSVSATNHVCYASRAGMGFSDPVGNTAARTAQDAVDDLTAVLEAAGEEGPYVLVGHSFGGLVVRLFADQHRQDVVGMVLVDATHEDQTARVSEALSPQSWAEVSGFFQSANPERMDLEVSGVQVGSTGDLGDLPLAVLEAAEQASDAAGAGITQAAADELDSVMAELWPEFQLDQSGLSTNSTHRRVEDSGHFIQLDQPDAVIDAIRAVLAG